MKTIALNEAEQSGPNTRAGPARLDDQALSAVTGGVVGGCVSPDYSTVETMILSFIRRGQDIKAGLDCRPEPPGSDGPIPPRRPQL
jgi:hypothetical protein